MLLFFGGFGASLIFWLYSCSGSVVWDYVFFFVLEEDLYLFEAHDF